MGEWDSAVARAAVWYIAAFGAIASVLLAGAQFSRFEWGRAAAPLAAVAVMATAVGAAVTVITLACRVLVARYTLDQIVKMQRRAQELARKGGKDESDWAVVADHDTTLRRLFTQDGFSKSTDDPISLRAASTSDGAGDTARENARQRLTALLDAANARAASRHFTILRIITPLAALAILACTLAWPTFARLEEGRASAADPIPVRLTLAPGTDPSFVMGADCRLREFAAVAVAGDLQGRPVLAVPPQGNCLAAVLQLDPGAGSVVRAG